MTDTKKLSEVDEVTCLEAIDWFYAYLDGELDDKESIAKMEGHLSHCRFCLSRKEFENALTERVRKSAKRHAPDTLQTRMKDLINRF
jgi:anti-sigma factor (TIGR02949 family)